MESSDLSKFAHYSFVNVKHDQRMLINPNDQYICRSLINNGVWEDDIQQLIHKYYPTGTNIIDIGANIGCHTLFMSHIISTGNQVHAFEPMKQHYENLMVNCLINHCTNVVIYRAGCADSSSQMFVPSQFTNTQHVNNYGGITLSQQPANSNDEHVHVICVDDLNLSNVGLIKIDAETMEYHVLLGLRKTIANNRPHIIIEIHPSMYSQVTQLLVSFKYILQHIRDIDYVAFPQ
jgi:FkbM family methyltransferase